jgi:RNA polymerase sigma factor (sigma-70 family)
LLESDDLLVARARQGDTGAYAGLVLRYQELAFRIAYTVLADVAEAEDAAQEAFIKAYYALPRFRTGAPFRPWLLQIVANQARNRRRAGGRRGALALRASVEDSPSGSGGQAAPSPEVGALIEERRQTLLRAVNGLRDEDRVIVAYRYFFDLSEADMATALGCARGTVKSRLSRALGRLREALAGAGLTESAGHEVSHG